MSEKLSFSDRFSKSIEARIEADKYRSARDNGIDFLKNSTVFFGADTEEKRLELMDRVFARFGKGDRSFQDIVDRSNNPTVNRNVGLADKESFINSVFIAMNASVSGADLVTDSMSAEDIDSYLPESCKGVGAEIKKITIQKFNEDEMIKVNKVVSILDSDTVSVKDRWTQIEKVKDLIKDTRISPLVRLYAEISLESVSSKIFSLEQVITSHRQRQQFRPSYNEEGEAVGGVEAAWQVTPEKLAEAMQFMDDPRWSSATPPEWFKALPEVDQARIEYMIMINSGASYLANRAGKDLDKIRANPLYFQLDNKKMTILFSKELKLVYSKMLTDLCEFYTDQNGRQVLRYKEGINQIGKDGIAAETEKKLESIRTYKDELALFLAKQAGRKEPSYLDRMNAYTAWNLFYVMGDSSLCDRRRVLPTYTGIISDGIRTLNPEYKAMQKWKIGVGDDKLSEAEWFGGPLGAYVQTIMSMEKKIGPIDKETKKTIREKIADGTFRILANKMCYGFFDFTSGSRDLYDKDGKPFYDKKTDHGESVTLAQLLRYYAFDESGRLIDESKRREFSFGNKEVDFMNWFRDQQEAAALTFSCITGNVDVKDVGKFVSSIRTAFGMINGIGYDGKRVFNYTTKPDLWANILLGSFGVDMSRLSTDHVRIKAGSADYGNFVLNFLTKVLKLNDMDVDIRSTMKYLGVDIKDNEKLEDVFNKIPVVLRNDHQREEERKNTVKFYQKYRDQKVPN